MEKINPTDPLARFADHDQETRDRISLVIHRGCHKPSPYHSYAEWNRNLADAYDARAAFWAEVVEWAITTASTGGVMFSALIGARTGAEEDASRCRGEARDADERDAARATTRAAA